MRRPAPIYCIWLLAAACLAIAGSVLPANAPLQTPAAFEAGALLSRTFTPAEYGGSAQNWAVVQDARGIIYVGNTEDGVLEFDGVRWRRIPLTNRGPVLSLAADESGRIYVGGVGEIGYLAPDEAGRMRYTSLLARVPAADRDFADVYKTYTTAEGVYFCSFRRVIRVTGDAVRVWNAASAFHFAFRVRDTIFVREVGRGLMKLRDDAPQLVAGTERFAHEKIYAMLPWPSAATSVSILIGTARQGWWIHDGLSLRRWATQADSPIDRHGLYDALWLADGRLAAATLDGGVFLLDAQGRLLGRIDKRSGLPSDVVNGLYQDRRGSLWLALDHGIARVEVATPLTRFDEDFGIEGSALALHRYAGILYAGTTQGLYRLNRLSDGQSHFAPMPAVHGETLAFLNHSGELLIANRAGVFALRGGVLQLVWSSPQGASALLQSLHDPQRVFIGMQNGLSTMRLANGRWLDEGRVPAVVDDVRTMLQEGNRLWLATTTGVLRLTIDETQRSGVGFVKHIERFGEQHGLPRGYSYAVGAIDGQPRFATARGIYFFDADTGRFAPDARLATLYAPASRQVLHFNQDGRGRVWMRTIDESRTVREIGVAVAEAPGQYRWDASTLNPIGRQIIDAIYADADGAIWLGGEGEIYRYDSRVNGGESVPFAVLIREVSTRAGRLVFGGAGAAQPREFDYSENALRFEFAAPGSGEQAARFQVRLEGADKDWMPWSSESHREYTNLREGAYRFHLRAMDTAGLVRAARPYEFRVLPPWYRTWPAYLAYAVALAGLIAVASRWRSVALRQRNRELARLVAARTQELQAANTALTELSITDSVTGLKNRRHFISQIEHDVAAVHRAYAQQSKDRSRTQNGNIDLLFVLVDIDHFKQVNDHYGHAAGDHVLRQFARLLLSVCRETDTAVRWGGEEFMVLTRFAGPDSGPLIAERIRALTAAHVFLLPEGKSLRRTCSIGFASFPLSAAAPDQFTWEDAVELADQCLYKAKHDGRNTWFGVRGTQRPPARESACDRFPAVDILAAQGSMEVLRPALLTARSNTAA